MHNFLQVSRAQVSMQAGHPLEHEAALVHLPRKEPACGPASVRLDANAQLSELPCLQHRLVAQGEHVAGRPFRLVFSRPPSARRRHTHVGWHSNGASNLKLRVGLALSKGLEATTISYEKSRLERS